MTVSWNIPRHSKTLLLGHSDTYTADIGHLRVTYHHNFFDGTEQRHPRARFGEPVHVFNNYYLDNGLYGIASTENAGLVVEGNYFSGVAFPIYVGYDDSGPGRVVERNNVYVNSGTPQTAGTVSAAHLLLVRGRSGGRTGGAPPGRSGRSDPSHGRAAPKPYGGAVDRHDE